MDIQGLQKMTLLDFPGRVACTVFLAGCDMRCPFCHNSELIDGSAETVMKEDEFLRFLEKRRGLLDGVALTGGEPLMRRDIVPFIRRIREEGYPVKLDTNGNHPEELELVLREGLVDYVAMDVKNSPDRYARTAGREGFDMTKVTRSRDLLLRGNTDYEFRTTVVAQLHDEESFRGIAEWISGARRYYLQPFTDRDTVAFSGLTAPSREELERYLAIVKKTVPESFIRGD